MRTRGLDDLSCLVGEELGHASRKGSVLHLHPCKTMGTVDLGGILQARDVLPGELLPVACGGDEVLDRSAGGERLGEGVERTALGEGEVLHLQTEAQVGLVAAVCVHRIMVGEPPEVSGKLHVEHLPEHVVEQVLHKGKHIVPLDVAHLDVKLGELQLSVAPGVLVAVAAGDLEVLVHARDHQQLLVQLRRLGKGEELSGSRVHPPACS